MLYLKLCAKSDAYAPYQQREDKLISQTQEKHSEKQQGKEINICSGHPKRERALRRNG